MTRDKLALLRNMAEHDIGGTVVLNGEESRELYEAYITSQWSANRIATLHKNLEQRDHVISELQSALERAVSKSDAIQGALDEMLSKVAR